MDTAFLPYSETGRFSKLISDYLEENQKLQAFYTAAPTIKTLKKQAQSKAADFSKTHRQTLVKVLRQQYTELPEKEAALHAIAQLEKPTTLTVTTGHQLCLMTGPLYFLYKIISTIKLCEALNAADTDQHYVPIYWMASEDHDFDEVRSFRFQEKKIQWNKTAEGAVGRMRLDDLQPILDVFEQHLGNSPNALALKKIIALSYRSQNNLAAATRALVHELFGEYGLVIIDADDKDLKKAFIPYMKQELLQQTAFKEVNQQIEALQTDYDPGFKPQVNPRALNLFYLTTKGRYRIVETDGIYALEGAEKTFSQQSLLTTLEDQPERFSPNVLLRPLYQEVILPNICYIGGGGELAYWLELKTFFESQKVAFPLLLLRNSALLLDAKKGRKAEKLGLRVKDLFLNRNALINKKIRQISNIDLDLSPLKKQLDVQFSQLEESVSQTDASFEGAVKAQKAKQFKGIDQLEKRLLLAQKRKLADQVQRLVHLHEYLFPGDSLQERSLNFTEFYLVLGADLIPLLFEKLDPLRLEFTWIEY